MDWASLFQFQVSPFEIVVRGSLVYWFIFAIFRFVMHRDAGAIGMADVLLIVLIADAAQNAMSAEYKTVSEGFLLIATLVFWNWLIDWLAYRSPAFARLIEPPPLKLVENGRVLHRNLRKENLSLDELMAQLRVKGIDDLARVKLALMESDGQVSVIPRKHSEDAPTDAARKHPL